MIEDGFVCQAIFISIEFFFGHRIAVDLMAVEIVTVIGVVMIHGQNNLGVGDFDLASRAFSQNQTEQLLRFGDSGVLGKKVFNETRFQARWVDTEARSATTGDDLLHRAAHGQQSRITGVLVPDV